MKFGNFIGGKPGNNGNPPISDLQQVIIQCKPA